LWSDSVANKSASVQIIRSMDGASYRRGWCGVISAVIRMGENGRKIPEIHAVDFVEIKKLITHTDEQMMSPNRFRPLAEDRAQAVRAHHQCLQRGIVHQDHAGRRRG